MLIHYKNRWMERVLIGVNAFALAGVVGSFVGLFGFAEPLLPIRVLHTVQFVLLCVFVVEKTVRRFNAVSAADFWRANWIEIPLLVALGITVLGACWWSGDREPAAVRHFAVGIYLVLQVVMKLCRTSVSWAASGVNPTRTLILSFVVLIVSGAGLLMLPRASTGMNIGFVDAMFTATSATCVTGLVVKDIGKDYSFMGQLVILSLIQLGGLGIVVFGAVFALLLGQALSVRESSAMQDLLSESTLSRIGRMIVFVFAVTVSIEALGAVSIFGMWDNVPGRITDIRQQWFCSIFHSISAFCNAGFSLFSDNFAGYNRSWGIYVVICPLIVLGGLGFGVLYDIVNIAADRVRWLYKKSFSTHYWPSMKSPRKMWLQTKIVLVVTVCLIVFGMLGLLLFESATTSWRIGQDNSAKNFGILDALFQSITARTAGFSTVDIGALSAASKFVLIVLMFIGGSPGGTAGGIKTVTLAVVIMTVVATLRKREEVEIFRRSVRAVIMRRAITIMMLFVVVLFGASLALAITENSNGFSLMEIMFEAASALGTVGLSCGITPSLTTAGKLIIIVLMLVGRLGPLTLLAVVTFNLKPARYNYPDEVVIVG